MLPQMPAGLFALGLALYTPLGECLKDIIVRDIAIIGGGASGTFSAIRLRDEGQSVVLIEKESILGGHVNTYLDPVTGQTVDYGVAFFHDQKIVKDYFTRLNVSWATTPPIDSTSTTYLDVRTAEQVDYTSPDPTAALVAYGEQLSKYAEVEFGFFLPKPVPEDLLLPFGDFISKYPSIGNATFLIFSFGQGLGDFLRQPTLYVFKNFGLDILQDISTGFLITASQNNYEIYDHATQVLGSDVLLNSHVVSTSQRDQDGVQLEVQTPSGPQTIQARKLLITIPQKVEELRPFALDSRESDLFSQFVNTGYYTCLVNNTGFPPNFTARTVSPDTPYNIPKLPGVYSVSPTVIPGVFDIKYVNLVGVPDSDAQRDIISFIKKIQANGFAEDVSPDFVRFSSHTPFELTVSTDLITQGFYDKLYALQGHRNTWYTGAAFHSQDSAMLWNFTESYVLPDLLQ